MNHKGFWAIIVAALLLSVGIAANGYFVSQQGVEFLKYQEEAFHKAMRSAPKSLDSKG